MMTLKIAGQIASLINERNQLSKNYDAEQILNDRSNYVFMEDSEELIACAESKKVQWYQWEICHVSVSKKHEGKGNGSEILKRAEAKAIEGNARILQSTIRSDNQQSINLFLRNGYQKTTEFFNSNTGNTVNVYQKSILQKK